MKYINNNNQGFSLVEVFVAITILLMVTAGPMRILSTSNKTTNFSNDQVTAYFLAQEGQELVALARDNLVLGDVKDQLRNENVEPAPWLTLASTSLRNCFTSSGCGMYPVATTNSFAYATTSSSCSGTVCLLYINSNSADRARFTHVATGNSESKFTRVIKAAPIYATDGKMQGIVATSTVTWRTGDLINDQKVELVTYLTNVYETN